MGWQLEACKIECTGVELGFSELLGNLVHVHVRWQGDASKTYYLDRKLCYEQ